jgi:predicted ATPase/class 3 adenylate cyclase
MPEFPLNRTCTRPHSAAFYRSRHRGNASRMVSRHPPEQTPSPAPDVRKTVTILFADIVDSSRLSRTLDPEAFREVLARYFGALSAIVRRHGGVVEKYIGDALMAVFGVPVLHEDDALRAVRAAVEMRERLAVLNGDLEATWGVRIATRIGVYTGEVIAGDHRLAQMFVTGEPVNMAKRLEEAAAADEILIGPPTHRLVRDAVVVEPGGPRVLGQGPAVQALAVVDIRAHAPGLARRFDAPFVGRQQPSAQLAFVFGRVAGERACHLLTVLGGAGVGKSRLVREFTRSLPAEVRVLSGRCLPYGEGITYWPLAEIVRDITRAEGVDPGQHVARTLAALVADDPKAERIGELVAQALGLGGAGGGSSEETFWAVRRLFEALARAEPLVVVLDDLHWAEPTFLDMIEHIVDFARAAPILLVGLARPELVDARPAWASGRANQSAIDLEPLSEAECRQLVANLLGSAPLPPAAEARIARAADGNALFAEELVAMLVDDGLLARDGDRWVASADLAELPVPSSIHTLLSARLESLPAAERAILTSAAVEGVVFHRGAAANLAGHSSDPELDLGLTALLRRDLIRREAADFPGEEAYRFRHVLIRDAAYRSLTKHARADLHERHAAWLEWVAQDRLREFEEIVGYHFEQAFQYRLVLGVRGSRADVLAARACERLEAAGRRALVRTDLPAAIALLERAWRLLASRDPRRMALLAEIGATMIRAGRLAAARKVLDEAERLAAAAADERAAAHVLVQQQVLRFLHVDDGGTEAAAGAVARVLPVFERCQDELGLCRARRLEGWLHWNEARAEAAAQSWERAAMHARMALDQHEHNEILTWIASSLWFGPTPAEEGIRRCELMRAEVRESPEAEAAILRDLAGMYAMVGSFAHARKLLATSNAAYAEFGLTLNAATDQNEAFVELLAGNPAAAEATLRVGYRALEEMGERAFRSTVAALLAQAILQQGRDAEAEELAALSAGLAASRDLLTQVLWRLVRVRVLARRAALHDAEELAREAVTIAEGTDFLNYRADTLLELAQVLAVAGSTDEAAASAAAALGLYDLKGNRVAAAVARRRLGVLRLA